MEVPSEPWGVALGLAWEAMVAGTTPVGCVVIDSDGEIVTRGRGRRYDRDSAPGQLSYSHLAHAELNALDSSLRPTATRTSRYSRPSNRASSAWEPR